jgi:hypothetical protein
MTPKQRKLETQMIIEESRKATKKYLEEHSTEEDEDFDSAGKED